MHSVHFQWHLKNYYKWNYIIIIINIYLQIIIKKIERNPKQKELLIEKEIDQNRFCVFILYSRNCMGYLSFVGIKMIDKQK